MANQFLNEGDVVMSCRRNPLITLSLRLYLDRTLRSHLLGVTNLNTQ